jgi:hypothetical protein
MEQARSGCVKTRPAHQLLHHLDSCTPIAHGEQQVQCTPPDRHVRVLEVGQDSGLCTQDGDLQLEV